MRALKVLSVFFGILFALAGAAMVTSGGFVLGVYNGHTDSSGFFTTPSQQVGSYGFALTAPDINQQLGPQWNTWVVGRGQATVRISGTSELPAPLFMGVAPTSQVSRYLSGVTRDRITGIDLAAGQVSYNHVDGLNMPASPGTQSFWVAKTEGMGAQTLEWKLQEGDWTVVIMNGDATPPVAATLTLGARFGIITSVVAGLLGGGIVVLAVAGTLIALGVRRRRLAPASPAFRQSPPPTRPPHGWAEEGAKRP